MTDKNYEPLSDKDLLQSKLDRLPHLFARLDSDNDNEAFAAVQKIKKSLKTINALQKKITGEDPELNFAKLYAMIDANAGIDATEFEAMQQENEDLRAANQQFADAELKYKERIADQEQTITNLMTPKKPVEEPWIYNQPTMHQHTANLQQHLVSLFQQNAFDLNYPQTSKRTRGPSP